MMYPNVTNKNIAEFFTGADEYVSKSNPGGWNPLLTTGLNLDLTKLESFVATKIINAKNAGCLYLSVYDIEGHGFVDGAGQNQSYVGDPFVSSQSTKAFTQTCHQITTAGLLPGCTLRPTTMFNAPSGDWMHIETNPGGANALILKAKKAYALGCRYFYIDSNVSEVYNTLKSPNETEIGVIPGTICSRLAQALPSDTIICWEQFEYSMSTWGLSLLYMNSPNALSWLQSNPDTTFAINDSTVAQAHDPIAARIAVNAAYAKGHFKIVQV